MHINVYNILTNRTLIRAVGYIHTCISLVPSLHAPPCKGACMGSGSLMTSQKNRRLYLAGHETRGLGTRLYLHDLAWSMFGNEPTPSSGLNCRNYQEAKNTPCGLLNDFYGLLWNLGLLHPVSISHDCIHSYIAGCFYPQ